MKTNILSLLAIAGLLTFAGCANDDTANKQDDQEPGTKGLTSFVEEDNTTRTTAEYDGSGLNFYWTEDDRLWVNTGTTLAPVLTQDSKNNINSTLVNNPTNSSAVKRVNKAKFWFAGTYTANSYPVRYTGKHGQKDKVFINYSQSQTIPNDASHIGEDGDCGVATATKPVGGTAYHFTLDHKAAYATFIPYTSESLLANAKIQKIRVWASKPIWGIFNFDDNGIDLSSRPTAIWQQQIELVVNDFPLPAVATPSVNAATMVLAPGTYSKLYVEYTLNVPDAGITGTVVKKYTNVTFTAGKNKKISQDLQVPHYSGKEYYMWDAAVGQHYWAGYESNQPTTNGAHDEHYPKINTDPRWYNATAVYPTLASRSCAGCPNVNESFWYTYLSPLYQNWMRWDNILWATMGHLYNGGLWIKKQSAIAAGAGKSIADLKSADPDGIDQTTASNHKSYGTGFNPGRPDYPEIDNYFYLPALGYYENGTLHDVGSYGLYWITSLVPGPGYGTLPAYHLCFSAPTGGAGPIEVRYDNPKFNIDAVAGRLWSSSNEDLYRPNGL